MVEMLVDDDEREPLLNVTTTMISWEMMQPRITRLVVVDGSEENDHGRPRWRWSVRGTSLGRGLAS